MYYVHSGIFQLRIQFLNISLGMELTTIRSVMAIIATAEVSYHHRRSPSAAIHREFLVINKICSFPLQIWLNCWSVESFR